MKVFKVFGLIVAGVFCLFAQGENMSSSVYKMNSMICANEYGSEFSLSQPDRVMSASFRGWQEDSDMTGFQSLEGSELIKRVDFIQPGIIGLFMEASNSEGFNGHLGIAIGSDQEYSLKGQENLSIIFQNAESGQIYIENMDCEISFE